MKKIYEFGRSPLVEANKFVDGERYVTSSGDVLMWVNGEQDFILEQESPLDLTLEGNTMENLTDVQLKLFWTLCK